MSIAGGLIKFLGYCLLDMRYGWLVIRSEYFFMRYSNNILFVVRHLE